MMRIASTYSVADNDSQSAGGHGTLVRAPARNISVLHGVRRELGIVERRAVGRGDRQQFSGERVPEGGEREDVVGKRPTVLVRERILVSRHRRAAQPSTDGSEAVLHRRTRLELAAGEIRGPDREAEIIL